MPLVGFGAGAAGVKVIGEGGVLCYDRGQYFTRPIIARGPTRIDNPLGLGGPIYIDANGPNYPIGKIEGAALDTTDDQVIQITGGTLYRVRSILFTGSDVTPVLAEGGIYTLPAKGGDVLVPADTTYTTLDGPLKHLEITPSAEVRSAPYLYFSLSVANAAAAKVDIFVFGDVLRSYEG